MWKRVFAVLGSVFMLALCLLPCVASANTGDSTDYLYSPMVLFDSLVIEYDDGTF